MADQDIAKSGCFSRFLQILLCAHSGNAPPVHPSDHFAEPETKLPNKASVAQAEAEATPGVVARLMGLDSLPNSNWVSKGTAIGSVPRSKSVNFVDYLLEFDLKNQRNHRRVRTSSFREVPALHPQQNHDPVVLYWDNASKSHDVQIQQTSTRKSEVGCRESKQRKKQNSKETVKESVSVKKEKNKKISNLKNEPRRVPTKSKDLGSVSSRTKNSRYRNGVGGGGGEASSSSRTSRKEEFVEPRFIKRIRNQKSPRKMQSEYCAENLSPVSVLEVDDDFTFQVETNFSDEASPLPLASKSKTTSSTQLYFGEGIENRGRNNKGYGYPEGKKETEYWSESMAKLRRLTENEIKESECTPKRKFETESFEEISLMFEHKIFDLLLHEVVNELVEL